MRHSNSLATKEGGKTFQMQNMEWSIEYARQASGVFVKPLAQQSVLVAIGDKWHSRIALQEWQPAPHRERMPTIAVRTRAAVLEGVWIDVR